MFFLQIFLIVIDMNLTFHSQIRISDIGTLHIQRNDCFMIITLVLGFDEVIHLNMTH